MNLTLEEKTLVISAEGVEIQAMEKIKGIYESRDDGGLCVTEYEKDIAILKSAMKKLEEMKCKTTA